MKLPRRRFLHLAAGVAALPTLSRIARAQAYPARPVRVIVGYAAGGVADLRRASDGSMAVGAARPAIRHRESSGRGDQYRHRGGCEFVPPTATRCSSSARRMRSTRRSTISSTSTSYATSCRLRAIMRVPMSWRCTASFPAKTVPEFIAYAKANPRQDQHGVGRHRHLAPCRRRAVQDDGRHRDGSRALSRRARRH